MPKMPANQSIPAVAVEVIAPDGNRRAVRVEQSPYLIGRGGETGNHLQLPDRRISRQCAAIVYADGRYRLEDRGQRRGVFVNGEKVSTHVLREGDVINFGVPDSFELVFHASDAMEALPDLLSRMEHMSTAESGAAGLRQLSLLLEATALLHSQLPLEAVLAKMVDHAILLTDADRGLLLVPGAEDKLTVRLSQQRGGRKLPTKGLEPSQTAIRVALDQRRGIITEDVAQADQDLRAAHSVIAQRLRAVVVIPLYVRPTVSVQESTAATPVERELLGVLYLDSRRPAAFSRLERQILDALALEAASVLENARLVERERERQRLQQELAIARDMQQALLPREFRQWPHLQVGGLNRPCRTVGGDYFDVLELGPDRVAFLIADVSGKGLGAALLATMFQGAISGMCIGQDPASVFAHVNRFLCQHFSLERYATAFFGILDCAGKMEFINAGHPSPLLLRASGVEAPFEAGSYPVGLFAEATFETQTYQLRAGDTIVLFSDGVTEALDPDDREFGASRLKASLQGLFGKSIDEVQAGILTAVEEFTRGAGQADDLTLLLVRYAGATEAAHAASKAPAG